MTLANLALNVLTANTANINNISANNLISGNVTANAITSNLVSAKYLTANIVTANVMLCNPMNVANLPDASVVGPGAKAVVNDANNITFASKANSGGSNVVSVTSNGTFWRIG